MGTTAIEKTLGKLPIGTPRAKLEQVRDECMAMFNEAIRKKQIEREAEERPRREAEMARRQAEQQQAETQRRAELRLISAQAWISDRLQAMESRKEIVFTGFMDRWGAAEKLAEKVRPVLVQELLQTPDMSDDTLRKRAEHLVDEHTEEVRQPRLVISHRPPQRAAVGVEPIRHRPPVINPSPQRH